MNRRPDLTQAARCAAGAAGAFLVGLALLLAAGTPNGGPVALLCVAAGCCALAPLITSSDRWDDDEWEDGDPWQ